MGAAGLCSHSRLGFAHLGITADHRQVPGHQGEGLVVASFASAQFRHRIGPAGVTDQMKTTDALDREDAALGQQLTGPLHGIRSPTR